MAVRQVSLGPVITLGPVSPRVLPRRQTRDGRSGGLLFARSQVIPLNARRAFIGYLRNTQRTNQPLGVKLIVC
jgi:hypothetical protein